MADSKITDLTGKTLLAGTEELVLNDSGADRKVAATDLLTGTYCPTPRLVLPDSTRYYTSHMLSGNSNIILTADLAYYIPVTMVGTATRIGVNVTTSQTGGLVRLGIYSQGADGLPDTLLLDAGTVDCSSTGGKEITISQAINGTVYLACVGQSSGTEPTLSGFAGSASYLGNNLYGTDTMGGSPAYILYEAGVTGALADAGTFGYSSAGFLPKIYLRIV